MIRIERHVRRASRRARRPRRSRAHGLRAGRIPGRAGPGGAAAAAAGSLRPAGSTGRTAGRGPVPAGRAALPYPGEAGRGRGGRGSFDGAHDAIARRCGPVIGKRQIEQAVVHAAADIPAFCAARVPEPCTPGTLLVMSADCKGIVMRPGALRAATAKAAAKLGKMRTRLSAGEKPNRKRTAALVTVYDASSRRRGLAGAGPGRPSPTPASPRKPAGPGAPLTWHPEVPGRSRAPTDRAACFPGL